MDEFVAASRAERMSRFYVSQTKQREAALASAANHQSDNAPSQLGKFEGQQALDSGISNPPSRPKCDRHCLLVLQLCSLLVARGA